MKQAILITGAMGGLGSAIVSSCRRAFPEHAIIATDLMHTASLVEGINYFQLDVTSEESIRSVKGEIEQAGTRIWGLVNNAGLSDFFPVSEKPKEVLDRLFAVNTFGAVNMVRQFLPHLLETKGRVVNISSESIRLPAAFHPYAASKQALEHLSVSMRNELALKGIKLILVRPGAIETPFLNDISAMQERIGESIFDEYLVRFSDSAPGQIHRIVQPEKVATAILKALARKKPKRYYLVNNNPKLKIAQHLPHWLRDRLMQRMLKK
jgi:NAD(P)-dependent dehydrogenase (short-subunit alcohol dehydrogenase family)